MPTPPQAMRKKSVKTPSAPPAAAPPPPPTITDAPQPASAAPPQDRRDRGKTSCTVSSRMRQVVEQMITCDEEQYQALLQQTTVFVFKSQQSELITCFLEVRRRPHSPAYAC